MAENFLQILGGFLDSSVGKESVCNAGDLSSFPGSGRSAGEGIGYPLQYSWASLVAQLVKNLLAMQETWVGSLSWEDPLEEGVATHSSVLVWRSPMDRGAWRAGSVVVAHGLSCPEACRVFLDQGLNLCLLHRQADS